VGFLSEVEVGRDRVLEKVNEQITNKHQEGRAFAAQFEGGGENFDDGGGQHESRAQGDKIPEVGSIPVLLDNDGAPEHVGGCGGET